MYALTHSTAWEIGHGINSTISNSPSLSLSLLKHDKQFFPWQLHCGFSSILIWCFRLFIDAMNRYKVRCGLHPQYIIYLFGIFILTSHL
jgi:hypothetical protein